MYIPTYMNKLLFDKVSEKTINVCIFNQKYGIYGKIIS